MENVELEQSEDLERKKKAKMFSFSSMALKREYTIAIVTFVALNLLILGQNILDVVYVWVGFEWKGEFLKQFVHKGTYVLIISILLSAALVLYYFRANLNFFEKNKALKILVYIWLAQNAFLALSVIARNIWYIQYFNLAYKRIGVFFFILAVGIGLVSVMMKVKHRKSVYYLLRKNLLAVYLIVLSIGVFNWDKIIAEYNFAHSDRAFVHLSFLSSLGDAALPHLNRDLEDLKSMKQEQIKKFRRAENPMSPTDYQNLVNRRINNYKANYESKHWLEWNYSDWRAFKHLEAEQDLE